MLILYPRKYSLRRYHVVRRTNLVWISKSCKKFFPHSSANVLVVDVMERTTCFSKSGTALSQQVFRIIWQKNEMLKKLCAVFCLFYGHFAFIEFFTSFALSAILGKTILLKRKLNCFRTKTFLFKEREVTRI